MTIFFIKTAIPQPLASAFCLGEWVGCDALEVNGNGTGERKRTRSDACEGNGSIYYVLMKTSACFPILPSWPWYLGHYVEMRHSKSPFLGKNYLFSVFSSLRYLISHTGSFSSSATVLRKVGTSQRWLKGRLLISVTVEWYLALLLTI